MFNKIILVGRLTRDIELRYLQAGTAIATTGIATNHTFTQNGEKKDEVCFIDITFFGRSGEVANQYLRKGSKILVEGRLKFDSWVDQNGQKRSKHGVVVATMQMLDSKGDNQGGYTPPTGAPMDSAPQGGGYNAPAQGQGQSYQQPQQQQQQSYQQPAQQQGYQQKQQPSYNNQAAQQQSRQMPSAESIPTIDIDEDEIPF